MNKGVAEVPWPRFKFGMLEIVKVGVRTFSASVVVTVWAPEVPVMVMVFAPRAAELLAVKVRLADPTAGLGENDAVTPLGSPEATRLTLPVKPLTGFM